MGTRGSAAASPPVPVPGWSAGAPGRWARSREDGVRGQLGGQPLGAHGGPVDFHERPQHRPVAVGTVPVVQESVRNDRLTAPDRMVDLRNPVQRPAQVAVTAGVLKESEPGLGHGQRVADLQPYGSRIGHRPGRPTPAHLGPLTGELHAVPGGDPHPGSSGPRQVIRSASPASRSRASRRLVCSMRTPGAITQCICSGGQGHRSRTPRPVMRHPLDTTAQRTLVADAHRGGPTAF